MVNDSWAYIDRIKKNGEEEQRKAFTKKRYELVLNKFRNGIVSFGPKNTKIDESGE